MADFFFSFFLERIKRDWRECARALRTASQACVNNETWLANQASSAVNVNNVKAHRRNNRRRSQKTFLGVDERDAPPKPPR